MSAKGRDFAVWGITVNPTVATAAPHRIPVSTLRRSISFIGLFLELDYDLPCSFYELLIAEFLGECPGYPAHERKGFRDW